MKKIEAFPAVFYLSFDLLVSKEQKKKKVTRCADHQVTLTKQVQHVAIINDTIIHILLKPQAQWCTHQKRLALKGSCSRWSIVNNQDG